MYSGAFWTLFVLSMSSWLVLLVVAILKGRWIRLKDVSERGLKLELADSLRALQGWPAWVILGALVINVLFVIVDAMQ